MFTDIQNSEINGCVVFTLQVADDGDNYLPENDERPKQSPASVTNPSRPEELDVGEDMAYDDRRALTPSSPTNLDTSIM